MKSQTIKSFLANLKNLAVFLGILIFIFPLSSHSEFSENVIVSPLTLISYGQIVACGVKVVAGPSYEKITAEVKVEHKNGINIFTVRVGYQDASNNSSLSGLSLKTPSIETKDYFPKASFDKDGFLQLQSALDEGTGAKFIQELLVLGGEFSIAKKDGKIFSFELPKPISHSIRQAYLSCAGDLIGSNE